MNTQRLTSTYYDLTHGWQGLGCSRFLQSRPKTRPRESLAICFLADHLTFDFLVAAASTVL